MPVLCYGHLRGPSLPRSVQCGFGVGWDRMVVLRRVLEHFGQTSLGAWLRRKEGHRQWAQTVTKSILHILSFVRRFWALPTVSQCGALFKNPRNDLKDCNVFRRWLESCISLWNIRTRIDEAMDLKGIFYDMGCAEVRALPS